MKYLFESLDEQRRIPMSDVTWDEIEPKIDPDAPSWRWQNKSVYLPNDFMSSSVISVKQQFERWYKEFVGRWGLDGELVETSPGRWSLQGNEKWDKAEKLGSAAVGAYYAEKGSGGYTGD